MDVGGSLRSAAARHPWVADALLAALLMVAGTAAASVDPDDVGLRLSPGGFALGAVTCLALVVRRRWPVPVAAVTLAGAVASMVAADGRSPFVAAVLVAVYTVGAATDRTRAAVVGGAAALVMGAASTAVEGALWPEPRTLALVAWTGMAAALGDAVRSRRAYVAGMVERARRAEQSREDEARRRVVEERLRIARELHDAVAHHIAVVNVQAGVASHVLTSRPEAAEEALLQIRRATRLVLDELATMLGVLREPDGSATSTQPAPGLDQLDELVAAFGASGLRITYSTTGAPSRLPATVGLVAYRIVQEGLTNAHKYGTGTARLTLVHRPAALEIDISNWRSDRGDAARDGSGHGLIGMHERAAAVGGTVTVGPEPNGQYRVHAVLPVPDAGDL